VFFSRASLAVILAGALVASPAFATQTHKPTKTTAHAHSVHRTSLRHSRRSQKHILHGQQAIDPERVTQIQQALIRAHYMTGDANGEWSPSTVAAMQKYQADHGWQTKLTPDSRALKELGLGPDYSNALNAKSAGFASPVPAQDPSIPADQAAGFAAASGVNR
jgi:hypothetical protein